MRTKREVLMAIDGIKQQNPLQLDRLVEWFIDERELHIKGVMVETDDKEQQWHVGAVRELSYILETIENYKKKLETPNVPKHGAQFK